MIAALLMLATSMPTAHAHAPWHDGYHRGHQSADVAAMVPGQDPFRQLTEVLPDPNDLRLASGAPGPQYWQNEADHLIDVSLDPETHTLTGSERITYQNNSPHTLTYVWVQLDQNRFREDSIAGRSQAAPDMTDGISPSWLSQLHASSEFEAGMTIASVTGAGDRPLPYTIVDTMMRIDLPRPLRPGGTQRLGIDWSHRMVPEAIRARSRVEVMDDGLPLYEVAQWFPRMAAYTDVDGWQNKPFVGRGEFTLEFGKYIVNITVPDTFVVAGTGELRNPGNVLTRDQLSRLDDARTADRPVMVITADEAAANEERVPSGTRTWTFEADRVRDFAWAASPSFLWDAWGVAIPGTDDTTLAMSYFPAEGDPLWSRYSTQAVAHAVEVYSEMSTPYPWPVAISVNGPVGGMEYPMICFNGPRPEDDGTYSERTKYRLISVIIHEVGHNWFPMLINSDERQWTWMDEGLNTYVQFYAEQSWEDDYPSRRGEPRNITDYMASSGQRPIMTNSESVLQFGNNAYGKPATALVTLRETVIGRERFDHAFRTYSERWRYKRPQPQDLFRTLEDASGTDLDWFWRGWFYTTGNVDIAVTNVQQFALRGDPPRAAAHDRAARDEWLAPSVSELRAAGQPLRVDAFEELRDFYNEYDELDATPADTRAWERVKRQLEEDERVAVEAFEQSGFFYVVHLENRGGVVMPVPIHLVYADGTEEELVLPAELWRRDSQRVAKLFVSDRELQYVEVDRHGQIADTNVQNNRWPQVIERELVSLRVDEDADNPMQLAQRAAARAQFEPFAQSYAKAVFDAWSDAQRGQNTESVLVPAAVEQPLQQAGAELLDPWSRPVRLSVASDPEPFESFNRGARGPGTVRIATFRSAGEDGAFETSDDWVWRILANGETRE